MSTPIDLVLQEATIIQLEIVQFNGAGPRGLSAYQVAVANGYEGTEVEWLESLNATASVSDISIINAIIFG